MNTVSSKLRKQDGMYVLEGVGLSKSDSLLLEHGETLDVNVSVVDDRHITNQQRKFIFHLLADICEYSGEDAEKLRIYFMSSVERVLGINKGTLTAYSVKEANLLIESIIEYGIINGFINVERCNEYDYSFDERQIYAMTLQRVCCVCGRHHADIHHYDQIGTKGNRDKVSHIGMRVMPLCRKHHTEFHTIGKALFDKRYGITPCVVDDKMERFIKKGIIRIHESDTEVRDLRKATKP